jgi:hypothetical protein
MLKLLYTKFQDKHSQKGMLMKVSHCAQSVLMVSPASFAFDAQTAVSNKFQIELPIEPAQVTSQALAEFNAAVTTLRLAGIDVVVHEGRADEHKPSAVFPNNWITTWPNGTVYTYPMATPSRRTERDPLVLRELAAKFDVSSIIDLSGSEADNRYLESTGAIVFDHASKVAYGCISERCDEELFRAHVKGQGYKAIVFHAYDQRGVPIYHTNVMMAIQSATAAICLEAITDPSERRQIFDALRQHHEVIDISRAQMNSFCGNMLEVQNRYGEKYLVLSRTAYDSFGPEQRQRLSVDKQLLPITIPTLEAVGGGSARCMLAEIFLPPLPVASPASRHATAALVN